MRGHDPGVPPRKLTKAQERLFSQCNRAAQRQLRITRFKLLTDLRTEGWTLSELATLFGCSKQRISLMLREVTADDSA